VLIVDETADEKSSADAVGAARQYSGTVGGIARCQVAVTLTYATSRGHALIGRALYLPEASAADEEHRELAGVPEQVMFATKPQLAGDLIERAHAAGIRAAFVAGDEVYGGRELRRGIRQRGMGYAVALQRQQEAGSDLDTGWFRLPFRNCCGCCATPSSRRPGETRPTGCTGRPGDAATSTAPAKPTDAGTPTPTQHHDHNELQLP
jgi:hypothetical protein